MAGGRYNPNFGGNASIITTIPGAGAVAVNAMAGSVFTFTPTASSTLTATVVPAGDIVFLVLTTSGTSSFTTTFGTGFKTTATLASGTVTAKVFTITFVSDGVNLNEVARTTAM